jgi:hypothetical protein
MSICKDTTVQSRHRLVVLRGCRGPDIGDILVMVNFGGNVGVAGVVCLVGGGVNNGPSLVFFIKYQDTFSLVFC